MKREDLLKLIAEKAYDVGFGAKKHFSTYDIVIKMPGFIGLVSMAIGILALFIDILATKHISAILIIFGLLTYLINIYNEKIEDYASKGNELTKLFNELKELYFTVKSSDVSELIGLENKFKSLTNDFYQNCFSKQIMFSNWYAHYKFFWEMQIDWIEEQKKFKFWRDKIPLSFTISLSVLILLIIFLLLSRCL